MNKYSWGEEKKKVNYNSDHLECSSKRWKKKEKKIYAHLTPYKSASFKFIDYDSYVHFLKGKKKIMFENATCFISKKFIVSFYILIRSWGSFTFTNFK